MLGYFSHVGIANYCPQGKAYRSKTSVNVLDNAYRACNPKTKFRITETQFKSGTRARYLEKKYFGSKEVK